jgi:hypothetical protein
MRFLWNYYLLCGVLGFLRHPARDVQLDDSGRKGLEEVLYQMDQVVGVQIGECRCNVICYLRSPAQS